VEIEIDPNKRGVGKTALVVDDNPRIRKTIAAAFLSDSFKTCAEAENGREGIEVARQVNPDVIVVDLSMPIMNGLEAGSVLRKMFPDVPIILFTLYGDSVSKSDASKAGITFVMLKTAPLSALIDKAHELMGSQNPDR
jgi:CheY-like chemotaxis protein